MSVSTKQKIGLKSCLAATLICLGVTSLSPAQAQFGRRNNDELADRMARIESAISDLQGVVYAVEGSPADGPQVTYGSGTIPGEYTAPAQAGNIAVRMSQVERELQALTGRIEELSYRIDQNATRLETLTQALSAGSSLSTNRTSPYTTSPYNTGPGAVDPGTGVVPSGPSGSQDYGAQPYQEGVTPYGATDPATGGPVTLGNTSSLPAVTEPQTDAGVSLTGDVNADYDSAFNALLNGDYQLAEKSFSAFLEAYPDDPRSADAQFRLGEIYLATGANTEAARAFLNHVRTWPRDARAPESYLKLGTAYSRLGKTDEACKIFAVMDGKFPNASASVKQRLAVERGNAGC